MLYFKKNRCNIKSCVYGVFLQMLPEKDFLQFNWFLAPSSGHKNDWKTQALRFSKHFSCFHTTKHEPADLPLASAAGAAAGFSSEPTQSGFSWAWPSSDSERGGWAIPWLFVSTTPTSESTELHTERQTFLQSGLNKFDQISGEPALLIDMIETVNH